MMERSGAKTSFCKLQMFAALKGCANRKLRSCRSQELNAVVESHPSTGSGQAPSQSARRMGHPHSVPSRLGYGVLLLLSCALAFAQNPGPKADVIYMHANVYTGIPANDQFSSVLREEAIAVRGERILAVGKSLDIQKLKGPETKVVDLGRAFCDAWI